MKPRHASFARMGRLPHLSWVFAAIVCFAVAPARAELSAADIKHGLVECTPALLQDHNPGLADNPDQLICFQAYVSNFNTKARSAKPKYLGVPHWVAHHIARASSPPESGDRPGSWFTMPELADKGIAPIDDSYASTKAFLKSHKNWYERGHLAQKYLAERRGQKAAWFTHNLVNAVPQRSQFNKSAWLTLECMTGAWANKYGEVWVITGPVFKKNRPIVWLRSSKNKKAVPVAIPVGIFKIVLRKEGDRWDALGFVYPQTHKTYRKGPYDPEIWFKSVADIEQLTGERFFSGLQNADLLKQKTPEKLWPVAKSDYDLPACKQQQMDVQ